MSAINCIILTRVSSSDQNTDRQESELRAVAAEKGWNVLEVCEETITGKTQRSERWSLDRAEKLAGEKKIQKILIHEVSRLARKNSIIHGFVEAMNDLKVSIYFHHFRDETLMPTGRKNPGMGYMIALLGEQATQETEVLGDRVKSGMAQARITKGRTYGRKKGDVFSREKFLGRYPEAVAALRKRPDLSVRELAKLSGMSTKTAHRVKIEVAGRKIPEGVIPAMMTEWDREDAEMSKSETAA